MQSTVRTEIEELVEMCDNLCHRLGQMAAQDKRYCQDLCQGFDMMSWEAYKISHDIKFIYDRFGGF